MTSSRARGAASRRTYRPLFEQLEDRAVPATFTFAGFTFEQDSTPDDQSLLTASTYDGAIVTAVATTASATITGFPNTTTGFNASLALGTLVDASNPPRALELPAGGDGTTARSGVELAWVGGEGLVNASGDDIVIYEDGVSGQPEAFMIQVHNATTGTWSVWYYEPADSFAPYGGTGTAGSFATAIDLSNLGIASGDIIDAIRIVNMTDEDRMVNSSGIGQVIPEDNGATSSFLPNPGSLASFSAYSSTTLDPDLLYVGAFNALTNPLVDVQVTKTDGATSVNAGANVTYTIVVSNAGSNTATGTTFTDTLPTSLSNVSWTSSTSTGVTGSAGSGNGNISETLSLPAGSSITYTVNGTLSASATGTLSNTATATVSSSLTDVNATNNTATDTSDIVPVVDITVTKTDGKTNVAAGQQVVYTIVVSNAGQTDVNGTTFVDNFPTSLTNVSWTSSASGGATGNSASGNGNISETLDLPAGSSVTYTVTATVSASASIGSTISNTATVNTPSGVTDNLPSNNTATDTNTVTHLVDLSVTKTDNVSNVSPGQQVTYTIVATNIGASDINGAILTDNFPTSLTNVSWTSSASGGATGNSASGSGDINQTLNLPVGASVTYTVTATVSTSATVGSTISNTVTIATPSGTTDNNSSNNTATDTNTVGSPGPVDLSITKTDNQKFVVRGQATTYTIVVSNNGPNPAFGVQVQDILSPEFASATWTSSASGGATGNSANGSGDINETLNLPVGASVTYTLTATASQDARGGIYNTATVSPASGVTDTNPDNNTVTDRSTVLPKVVPAFFNQFTVGAGAGAQGHVKAFAPDGTLRFSFFAFEGFNGGVRVASGDVNGDGINDIVVGAGPGAPGGHVKVFDGDTGALLASFFTFEGFTGGVNVAVGDINGDGFGDVIVGSDVGAAHVKAFSLATGTPVLLASFFAYDNFGGGITVAAGDVNEDGRDDIITGVASGAPAHVKVFTLTPGGAIATLASFITLPGYTGGIDVAAGDLLGDGRAEFVIAPLAAGANSVVQIFSIDSTTPIGSFTPNFPGPDRGVQVALADADDDGDLDIFVAGGPGRGARVKAFDPLTLTEIEDFEAFVGFQGGVFIG